MRVELMDFQRWGFCGMSEDEGKNDGFMRVEGCGMSEDEGKNDGFMRVEGCGMSENIAISLVPQGRPM
jgi:hypothetical protein